MGAAFIVAVKYLNVQGLLRSALLSLVSTLGSDNSSSSISFNCTIDARFYPCVGAEYYLAIWGAIYVSIGATIELQAL